MPASIGYIRADTLRPLAVTTANRSEALPDLPSLADFVPGYESSPWYGICTPSNTPAQSSKSSTKGNYRDLTDPRDEGAVRRFGRRGDFRGRPQNSATLIADETEKRGKVIQAANIKVYEFDLRSARTTR